MLHGVRGELLRNQYTSYGNDAQTVVRTRKRKAEMNGYGFPGISVGGFMLAFSYVEMPILVIEHCEPSTLAICNFYLNMV